MLSTTTKALIIGSAGGILSAATRRLVESGYQVFLVDINESSLNDQVVSLPVGSVLGHESIDITNTKESETVLSSIAEQIQPGVLLNGVGGDTRVIRYNDLCIENFLEAYQENVIGTFNAIANVAPVMEKHGYGRIVNFASAGGRTYSHFNNAAYVASKAAVIGMTKQVAYELAATGVVANVVAHGPVATERVANAWKQRDPADKERVLEKIPMRRMATIEEAVGSILYLASESAGYTTGAVIDINGGIYI